MSTICRAVSTVPGATPDATKTGSDEGPRVSGTRTPPGDKLQQSRVWNITQDNLSKSDCKIDTEKPTG